MLLFSLFNFKKLPMQKRTSVLAVAALAFFLTACGDKKPANWQRMVTKKF